ncbi:efflux RND transporter periplasmic adaptor subunit [Geopsychrobacter electrodiphilus]|uniref:efflux RND transporter periplasmic adaptor subunit n=1 Tax=Geopsychrobacter electrodiphilus TaxID=225196 RepID=UPI00037B392B|nr:efflux RND transporter periplasmic adaptor subunit [Geopsychrobacter electrodiphilus]
MMLKQPLFFVLLLLLLSLSACSESKEKTAIKSVPQAPVQVQVKTLSLSEVPFQVEVAGTLQAVERALISSRVSGQITEMPVSVGSKVAKGDLLVKIRAAEINAKVMQAKTQLAQAERNLDRETRLLKVNASTQERVKSLSEMVQISKAGYHEALAMLDYTQVRAPFAGTVTHKMVDIGDLSAPGAPLLNLENGRALEVLVQVPEALAQGLSLGTSLSVIIPAAQLELQVKISEISPTADPTSRTRQIKLTLPVNPALRAGQFARVSLAAKRATTLLVPQSAVHQNGQMEQVYVAEQGVARMRLVRTGADYADQVEILSGLNAGEQIVISAKTELKDGQPLEIIQTGLGK